MKKSVREEREGRGEVEKNFSHFDVYSGRKEEEDELGSAVWRWLLRWAIIYPSLSLSSQHPSSKTILTNTTAYVVHADFLN